MQRGRGVLTSTRDVAHDGASGIPEYGASERKGIRLLVTPSRTRRRTQ